MLQGCSNVLTTAEFACPCCLDVPDSDYHSSHGSQCYCCEEHLLIDADAHREYCIMRQTWRTMSRAGALFNMIFMLERMMLSLQSIVAELWESESTVYVWMEDMGSASSVVSKRSWQVFSNTRLAAVSFERCVYITQLLRPILAWLLAGKTVSRKRKENMTDIALGTGIHIQAIDFMPKKQGQVYVAYRIGDIWWWMAPGEVHTVLLLKLPGLDEGLVLDGSSMQYLEPIKSHSSIDYYANKVQHLLHDSSNKHYRPLVKPENNHTLEAEDFVFELAIRTINNEVVSQVSQLGGRDTLFNLRDVDFWNACLSIERALHTSFYNLRLRFEPVILQTFSVETVSQILVNHDGLGHTEVMEAFERCRRNNDHAR